MSLQNWLGRTRNQKRLAVAVITLVGVLYSMKLGYDAKVEHNAADQAYWGSPITGQVVSRSPVIEVGADSHRVVQVRLKKTDGQAAAVQMIAGSDTRIGDSITFWLHKSGRLTDDNGVFSPWWIAGLAAMIGGVAAYVFARLFVAIFYGMFSLWRHLRRPSTSTSA